MEVTTWEEIEDLKRKLLVGLVKTDHGEYVAWCDNANCKGDLPGCLEFLAQATSSSYEIYKPDEET